MGPVVFWMGLWWNSFPLGKVGMGLTLGNSVGVAFSRRRYTQSDNTVLYSSAHYPGAVTPAAKRNTYSVAIMVVLAPRVAVFARNPGLGNRNTYSVAVACGKLCLSSPVSMWYGRVDYGPLVQLLPLGE